MLPDSFQLHHEKTEAYVGKIADVHGTNHPEVMEIASIFNKMATDFGEHLKEEEEGLFPAIKRVDMSNRIGDTQVDKGFRTINDSL